MATRTLPSQKFLCECFNYNPDTGVLTWRTRPRDHFPTEHGWSVFNGQFAGKPAGINNVQGYVIIALVGHGRFYAHRIIWKLVTGNDPPSDLDHINTNPSDNRWANLRFATMSQNLANIRKHVDNETGYKGVFRHRQKFAAQIMFKGVRHCRGGFVTAEEAHAAYCEMARKLFGEFWRP